MGHSMLGPHINWKADQIPWLARAKPRVAKALIQNVDPDWMRRAREASPTTFWVGRLVIQPQPLDDPEGDAERFTRGQLLPAAEPFRGLFDALEGYNEIAFAPFPSNSPLAKLARFVRGLTRSDQRSIAHAEMQRYAAFERKRVEILKSEGWRSVVGNFSAGTPELELWPDFYPALEIGDYLGLHEYDAPNMHRLDTWLCRRYRRVYEALPENLRKPLIITECGIDGGLLGQSGGWKRHTDANGYLAELRWYDESLQADAQRWPIVGATIYCYGHVDPRWETFDIQGEMADKLAAYMEQNPPQPWQVEPEPPVDRLVRMLSAEFGSEFDDIRSSLIQTGQFEQRSLSGIHFQVIHHTGPGTTTETYSNAIARYHVEQNGWPAIGYHFLVYPHKVRYVGSLDTARANVWGRNPEVIGIALVGNFQETPPPAKAISLCKRLCDVLDNYLGRAVPRLGHRDVALPGHETECPGDTAYGPNGWLAQIQPGGASGPTEPGAPGDEIEQLRVRIAELEQQLQVISQERDSLRDIIRRVREIVHE